MTRARPSARSESKLVKWGSSMGFVVAGSSPHWKAVMARRGAAYPLSNAVPSSRVGRVAPTLPPPPAPVPTLVPQPSTPVVISARRLICSFPREMGPRDNSLYRAMIRFREKAGDGPAEAREWTARQWFAVNGDPGETAKAVTVDQIILAISRVFAVTPCDIRSARRTATVVLPRQCVMYLARHLTTRSLPEIGRRMGGRDHTTVLHGIRKIEALRKTDAELNAKLSEIEREFA
jgi:hypothetical protein